MLAQAQQGRFLIEDFTALAESIEFQLGQQFWRERGSKAFISDPRPVPYAINNDGGLSRRAAEVFFASLVESERHGALEPELYVLELGIGVGLFARFFLDAFREICGREGKDYYRRLVYVAGDRSERMLADACRHGIFVNHPGRYQLRVVDAVEPGRYLADLGGKLRAVFLNYLLDCLPAAHLRIPVDECARGERAAGLVPAGQTAAGQTAGTSPAARSDALRLCVQTCLARHLPLAAIGVAKEAVELNPACSAELWNTLGDAYYALGKIDAAGSSYRRALAVNPSDVRGRYNLAWLHLDQRRYAQALTLIAEGLALDETGEWFERLLKKQNEVVTRLAQRNQHRQFLLANRVSSKPGSGDLPRPTLDAKEQTRRA